MAAMGSGLRAVLFRCGRASVTAGIHFDQRGVGIRAIEGRAVANPLRDAVDFDFGHRIGIFGHAIIGRRFNQQVVEFALIRIAGREGWKIAFAGALEQIECVGPTR